MYAVERNSFGSLPPQMNILQQNIPQALLGYLVTSMQQKILETAEPVNSDTTTFLFNSFLPDLCLINNGNRTEWSPIHSEIIRVINKIGRPRSASLIC